MRHPLSARWLLMVLLPLAVAGGISRPGLATEPATQPAARQLLAEADRIVVLGDSITYGGRWVALLDCWKETAGLTGMVIDMGLSSETVSGLSEDGHASGTFPRPDLHERLDRVLRVSRPDVVLACYGMNCGIYQPLDAERFARFRAGIERLHAAVEATGAGIIHLTPPIYDQRPDKPGPAGDIDYDEVLAEYSHWLLSKRADGWLVIDVHGPMKQALNRARQDDPLAVFAPDTVHPGNTGHWFICRAVLDGFGVSADWTQEQAEPLLPLVTKRMQLLRDAYLSAAGHLRPGVRTGLPLDEAIREADEITAEIRAGSR